MDVYQTTSEHDHKCILSFLGKDEGHNPQIHGLIF
jgi:hypothetical protein